jgi:hypothetical protein
LGNGIQELAGCGAAGDGVRGQKGTGAESHSQEIEISQETVLAIGRAHQVAGQGRSQGSRVHCPSKSHRWSSNAKGSRGTGMMLKKLATGTLLGR